MDATIFNDVMDAFIDSIDGGAAILWGYALPLLGILGMIYLILKISEAVVQGADLNGLLATCLWAVVKLGVFFWIITHFLDLTQAALDTFVTWGLAPSRGQFTLDAFLRPSSIVDNGFTAAVPLQDFIMRHTGWDALFNWPQLMLYRFAYVFIIAGFVGMALAVMMAHIEMSFSIMAAAVLFPWGILTQTAFLSELAISWLAAGLVRMFVTAALMGVSVPLFARAALPIGPGLDPDIYGSCILVCIAILFSILAWWIPNKAAGMAGRGAALALTGEHLVSSGMAGFQGAQFAARAVADVSRGVSQMVRG